MSPWDRILDRPDPSGHLVQMYDREEALVQNVGRFLAEGFRRDEGLVVVASAAHREMFCEYLSQAGCNVANAVRTKQLLLLDAQETLNAFMRDGLPEWRIFESVIGDALGGVRRREATGMRAYGEMVGILWNSARYSAAIGLEEFWNRLLGRSSFSLFCGYQIDVLSKEFQGAPIEALLCTHTHLVPGTCGLLEPAIDRALNDLFGTEAAGLKALEIAGNRSAAIMPRGEAMALAVRKNFPDRAEMILSKAREYYEASRLQMDLAAA